MIQIRRILCPCDFSEFSRLALDHAAALARWYHAELTAVHVLQQIVAIDLPPAALVGPAPIAPVSRLEIEEELARFVAPVAAAGVPVQRLVLDGDPARQVLAQAAKLDADLLVLGTHGRSGFERWVLGSVAEKILRKAACAVLTVSQRTLQPAPPGQPPFRRILCSIDLSPASLRALDFAVSLAGEGLAELVLLHVIEVPPGVEPAWSKGVDVDAQRKRVEGEIADLLRRVSPEKTRDRCRTEVVIEPTRAYREVLRIAAEQKIDLIAMGVTGRTGFDRLIFGSNTGQVVRAAPCPVLSVRVS
jgi:nucleotide-binding universal stress UspA family protein